MVGSRTRARIAIGHVFRLLSYSYYKEISLDISHDGGKKTFNMTISVIFSRYYTIFNSLQKLSPTRSTEHVFMTVTYECHAQCALFSVGVQTELYTFTALILSQKYDHLAVILQKMSH